MPSPTAVRPGLGPGRFLRRPGATLLAGAWVGLPVIGNNLTSVTLDFTMAPDGEWLFACIGLADSQNDKPQPPGGWGEVMQGADGASGGASSRLLVYLRRKQPDDTTFLFSWTTACNIAAWPIAWLDLDPVTPFESAVYNPHTSGTSYVTGTVTPVRADRRIAGVFFSRTTSSAGIQYAFVPPPEMKKRADVASTSSAFCTLEVADTVEQRPASAQTFTSTGPTASHGGAVAFALIPTGSGSLLIGAKAQPGPGRTSRLRILRPGSTDIPAAGGESHAGAASGEQRTSGTTTGVKGAAGAAQGGQRVTGLSTGVKGAVAGQSGQQRSSGTTAARKQAAGATSGEQRSSGLAGTAAPPPSAGTSGQQRVTGQSSGQKRAIAAQAGQQRSSGTSTGIHRAIGATSGQQRTSATTAGAKRGIGATSGQQRVAGRVVSLALAAVVKAFGRVSVEGARGAVTTAVATRGDVELGGASGTVVAGQQTQGTVTVTSAEGEVSVE